MPFKWTEVRGRVDQPLKNSSPHFAPRTKPERTTGKDLSRRHLESVNKFPKFLAIAGIGLAGLLYAADFFFGGMCVSLKTDRAKGDFSSIRAALQTYRINTGSYPTTEQGFQALVQKPTVAPIPDDWHRIWDRVPIDAWAREYRYRRLGEEPDARFELRSLGKDGIDGTKDDQSSLDP